MKALHQLVHTVSLFLLACAASSALAWLILLGGEARRVGIAIAAVAVVLILLSAASAQWLAQALRVEPSAFAAKWLGLATAFVLGIVIFVCLG